MRLKAHDGDTGETLVVDVPEAAPVMTALAQRGWTLSHVFLTHHHADHVDGCRYHGNGTNVKKSSFWFW